jgi:hypothetical protein
MKELFIIALLIVSTSNIFADQSKGCPLEASSVDAASHDMFEEIALVVTIDLTNETRNTIMDAVRLAGGSIYLVYPPNVMVGKIPQSLHPGLVGNNGIRQIRSEPVDLAELPVSDHNARAGVNFFNWVTSGEMAQEFERVKDIDVDIRTLREDLVYAAAQLVGQFGAKSLKPTEHRMFTNVYMMGLTVVDVFFLESVDNPSTVYENEDIYTWDYFHVNHISSRLSSGLWWWADVARAMGLTLEYILTFHDPTDSRQHVRFEPINQMGYPYDFEWVRPILANYGVIPGEGEYDSRPLSRKYGMQRSSYYGAPNGFPVFITYNPEPADVRYVKIPGQETGQSAFAWWGDYANMLFRSGGYPPEELGWVFAHEMGHVFYACDEYPITDYCESDCRNCYTHLDGPRDTLLNYNCYVCPSSVHTECIMWQINQSTWSLHSTCGITRLAIGWPY